MRRLKFLFLAILLIVSLFYISALINPSYNRALAEIKAAAMREQTTLDLRTLGLTQLPSEIGSLTNLTTLHLDSTLLNKLPLEISKLNNLRVLSLSGSELTELLPEIGCLTNLEFLNLAHNQLTELPPEIGYLNLTDLRLVGNPFDAPQAVIENGDWAIFEYYANQNGKKVTSSLEKLC